MHSPFHRLLGRCNPFFLTDKFCGKELNRLLSQSLFIYEPGQRLQPLLNSHCSLGLPLRLIWEIQVLQLGLLVTPLNPSLKFRGKLPLLLYGL